MTRRRTLGDGLAGLPRRDLRNSSGRRETKGENEEKKRTSAPLHRTALSRREKNVPEIKRSHAERAASGKKIGRLGIFHPDCVRDARCRVAGDDVVTNF